MSADQEVKNKAEALQLLGAAEAFFLVTIHEGLVYYRAMVPNRYPLEQVRVMATQVKNGLQEVETFVKTSAAKGLVAAPPNFDPKKIH